MLCECAFYNTFIKPWEPFREVLWLKGINTLRLKSEHLTSENKDSLISLVILTFREVATSTSIVITDFLNLSSIN